MNSRGLGTVARLVGIGWYVGICIGGGAAVGLLIDRRFDLAPLVTLLGLGVGIALAGLGMFRMLSLVLASQSDFKSEGTEE